MKTQTAPRLNTRLEYLPDNEALLHIEVSPDEVEKRVAQTTQTLAKEVRLPGFRPGKAPATLVRQRLGDEALLSQALQDHLSSWYADSLVEARILPIAEPKIEIDEPLRDGEAFTFKATVKLRPKAEVARYEGLTVEKPDNEVSQEEIQREVDTLREQVASLETVNDRPAAPGDFVLLDFDGTVDGKPFEGGQASDFMVEIGSGKLIPGFEEALEGMKGGEHKEISLTFPSNYTKDDLAGKEVGFAVHLKEIKHKVLPPVDDELAVSVSEFDTIEELRADIRQRLARTKEKEAERAFNTAVAKALVDQTQVEVPESLLSQKQRELFNDLALSLGASPEQFEEYLQRNNKSKADFLSELAPQAKTAVIEELALETVADLLEISITDEAVKAEVEKSAQAMNEKPQKLTEAVFKDGRSEIIRLMLLRRAAFERVKEAAEVVPKSSDNRDDTSSQDASSGGEGR